MLDAPSANASTTKTFLKAEIQAINEKITQALLRNAYGQTFISQLTTLLCATVILLALYTPNQNNNLVLSWYALFIGVVIYRYILFALFKKNELMYSHLLRWKILFILGSTLAGICWGIAGSVLLDQATLLQQTLIILTLAGVTAGAIMVLMAEVTALILFLSTAILPIIFQLLLKNYFSIHKIFVVALCVYYIYMIVVAIKTHHIIKNNYRLLYENEELTRNVTATKEQLLVSNQKLEIAATHDALTGLANRNLFDLFLESTILRTLRNHSTLAIFYIDLDGFKKINDIYGHHFGDEALKIITKRMQENVRTTDLIARLGGDEFALIMENFKNPQAIQNMANHLCQVISLPIIIDSAECRLTASIGVSVCPLDAKDAMTLLKKSDSAMYTVKELGGNNFHFFSNPELLEFD